METVKNISDWEVLTPSGWNSFSGINQVDSKNYVKIIFSDGKELAGALNHKIQIDIDLFVELRELQIGDFYKFLNASVSDIFIYEENILLYDLLNVENGNVYYTNDIVSHNCGIGNEFHKLCQKSIEGSRGDDDVGVFNYIELRWDLHPGRDQHWADEQLSLLGQRKFGQEFNCDFVSSGHTVIESDTIQYYLEEVCKDPIEKRGLGGDFWVWKYPEYTKDYLVVSDVARGDGADFSSFQIIDIEANEQVGEFVGKVGTRDFGRMLVSVALEWNNALLVIDNKNIGWDTVQEVINIGYANLFYSYKSDPYFDENKHIKKNYDLKSKEDMVPGLTITTTIRPVMISKIETYYGDKTPIRYSKRLMNQYLVFIWKDGKAQAQQGYNDDLVMADAMGLFMRDTSLKMRMMGQELTKKALNHVSQAIYTPKNIKNNPWNVNTGKSIEDITWLL